MATVMYMDLAHRVFALFDTIEFHSCTDRRLYAKPLFMSISHLLYRTKNLLLTNLYKCVIIKYFVYNRHGCRYSNTLRSPLEILEAIIITYPSNPVTMLTLTAHLLGEERTIHPVLLRDGDSVALVDAGYPGQLPLLEQALREAGVSLEQLTAVIVTHQDIDHIGGLPGLLQAAPYPLEVLAHPLEQPFIEGRQTLLKFSGDALKGIDSWPEAMSAPFKRLIANPPRADVTGLLLGGETLPYGGGVTVIPTPGHTPGHISLYHPASRTLIAADALLVEDGELQLSQPALTWDMRAAVQSVRDLCRYDIETVICYHGGLYVGNAAKRLNELASPEAEPRAF